MIKLHQFPTAYNLPNLSPFCMKLSTYFKLAGLPYEIVSCDDPRKGPKQKLPFIEDGGEVIADSDFIINHCKEKYPDNNPDAFLNPQQQSLARLVQRTFDEHLIWVLIYSRWVDERGLATLKAAFFNHLPFIPRMIVPAILRRKTKKMLYAQGMGRHAPDDIYQAGIEDLKSFAELLTGKPYLFGDTPSSADACVHAHLANFLGTPIETPVKAYLKSHTELQEYVARMDQLS